MATSKKMALRQVYDATSTQVALRQGYDGTSTQRWHQDRAMMAQVNKGGIMIGL